MLQRKRVCRKNSRETLIGEEAKLPLMVRTDDRRRAMHRVSSARCVFTCEVWPGMRSAQAKCLSHAPLHDQEQKASILGHVMMCMQAR